MSLVLQMAQGVADSLRGTGRARIICQGLSGRGKATGRTPQPGGRLRAGHPPKHGPPDGPHRPDEVSYMRFLERRGGFAGQQTLGLVAWQVAQVGVRLAEAGRIEPGT